MDVFDLNDVDAKVLERGGRHFHELNELNEFDHEFPERNE